MWCSAADTHIKLLDCAVSGVQFLTVDVFECNIAHRRSVAECLCCIRSGDPMHPLNRALSGLYLPM